MSAQLHNYLAVGAGLFVLGAIGFIARRNLIMMFLSAELMLQGVALNLVAFAREHSNLQGQVFVVMILTVAACEAALALALILALYQRRQTLDVSVWHDLHEPGQAPAVEVEPPQWLPPADHPHLTAAGREPVHEGVKRV